MKNNKATFLAISIMAFSFVNTQAREDRDYRDRGYRDRTIVGDTLHGAGRAVGGAFDVVTFRGTRDRREKEREEDRNARENRDRNERERDQEQYRGEDE